jgi:ABC-2 type transport system permease protein
LAGMIASPLSIGQSLIQVWPQLAVIIALAIICFALSYVAFMRQEIRST